MPRRSPRCGRASIGGGRRCWTGSWDPSARGSKARQTAHQVVLRTGTAHGALRSRSCAVSHSSAYVRDVAFVVDAHLLLEIADAADLHDVPGLVELLAMRLAGGLDDESLVAVLAAVL